MNTAFLEGKQAAAQGKSVDDNPYFTGEFTKLGTPRLSEDGHAWREGFGSIGRRATAKEVANAEELDVSRFRRKSNRYYR